MTNRSIEQVFEGYAAAVRAKDVEGFVALYARDVRVFDLWASWSYDDADAWREMAAGWFGSLGSEQVLVEFADVRMIERDAFAVATAFVTFKGLSADGAPLRSMTNRLTWALQQTADGRWTIVHEHTSAPAEVETGKVQLQRDGPG